MRFWSREILGWMLLVIGLGLLWMCLAYVNSRQVVEGSIVAFVGVMVFRAGVHFLKVAVAARIYFKEPRGEPDHPADRTRFVRAKGARASAGEAT